MLLLPPPAPRNMAAAPLSLALMEGGAWCDSVLRGEDITEERPLPVPSAPLLLRTDGAGLPPRLLALLLRRADSRCCSRSRFCRTYSVGSKRCLGGALLGRGGRDGVESERGRDTHTGAAAAAATHARVST
jgi:hypothetical protein